MHRSYDDFLADWIALWQVAERLARTTGGTPADVLEPVGLILNSPHEQHRAGGYDSSPADATCFASTGGDGVHFSAVRTDGPAAGLIVMTVPMQFDGPNHVLAESLPEFLALGSATGYFTLEQLAYDWGREEMIERLQASNPEPEAAALLEPLVQAFGLRPWKDVRARLEHLARMYADIGRDRSGGDAQASTHPNP